MKTDAEFLANKDEIFDNKVEGFHNCNKLALICKNMGLDF